MTEYQITYWREFPSMVVAREGRRNRHKVQLPARFQVAIDEAAMRAGATGTTNTWTAGSVQTGRSRRGIRRKWPKPSPRNSKPTILPSEYANSCPR